MKFVKSVVLVAVLMTVASLITGFWLLPEKYVSKSYAKRHPDFGKPDLGGIVMEGEFTSCNSDSLKSFFHIHIPNKNSCPISQAGTL